MVPETTISGRSMAFSWMMRKASKRPKSPTAKSLMAMSQCCLERLQKLRGRRDPLKTGSKPPLRNSAATGSAAVSSDIKDAEWLGRARPLSVGGQKTSEYRMARRFAQGFSATVVLIFPLACKMPDGPVTTAGAGSDSGKGPGRTPLQSCRLHESLAATGTETLTSAVSLRL